MWQVKNVASPGSIVLSGTAPLAKGASPNGQNWIWISASFLAATPPAKPASYQITAIAYNSKKKPIGATSAAEPAWLGGGCCA